MKFAKVAVCSFAIALAVSTPGCGTPRFQRDFPPRVDLFLASEFSHGVEGFADSLSSFGSATKRDAVNTYENLTKELPSYLGRELVERPGALVSGLSDFGSQEWRRAKELPASIWDFFGLLIWG